MEKTGFERLQDEIGWLGTADGRTREAAEKILKERADGPFRARGGTTLTVLASGPYWAVVETSRPMTGAEKRKWSRYCPYACAERLRRKAGLPPSKVSPPLT